MRILVSFVGGSGHFDPLVPVARAAEAAGHEVLVTCGGSMLRAVRSRGFTAVATVPVPARGAPPQRSPLLEVDREREDRVLRDVFAGDLARDRAAGVIDFAGSWRPDLIVCDEVDFGAMVAAETLGVPHVVVLVIAAGGFIRPEVVAEPIDVLRAQYGLPPDPDLAEQGRHLVLSPFPPSFRNPDFSLPATTRLVRPVPLPPGPEDLAPDWLGELGGRPVVYFTLGTIFPLESGDLFRRVLAGLRTLPVDVVVTVGRETDPSWLGPQPSHVHVERYVAQSLVLPRCSVVLSHGGSGSVIGALAHAVPVVVAPMGADQPLNASRCEALGIGRSVDAVHATPSDVAEAVSQVLDQPRYRAVAARVAEEIDRLPSPEDAVGLIEQVVRRSGSAGFGHSSAVAPRETPALPQTNQC